MYNRLVMYKKQHKSTQVPSAYTDENDGSHLGAWAARQRTKYNKGQIIERTNGTSLNSIDLAWVGR